MLFRVLESSDRSVLLILGDDVSVAVHEDVVRISPLLMGVPGVRNVHPAYASILVDFDPLETSHREIERAAAAIYKSPAGPAAEPRLMEIPVRYGGEEGPDLEDVAALCGLTPEEVIRIHSGAGYLVYFLGFSPGFPYLGGLPESIAVPRLETPRPRVPAGSVAIGGRQTGVYPLPSPGGWRLIGRTPLPLFDPEQDSPALLRMGDRVRFVPVSGGDL